ncbi:hypothetical protein SDC9_105421 [bioreactor metagenome]|uniref:Uncharacterized protein n=1 Tax=bioreactor metagenome TaxID=1076179 RepID=A0A645AZH7_9ZZZZ
MAVLQRNRLPGGDIAIKLFQFVDPARRVAAGGRSQIFGGIGRDLAFGAFHLFDHRQRLTAREIPGAGIGQIQDLQLHAFGIFQGFGQILAQIEAHAVNQQPYAFNRRSGHDFGGETLRQMLGRFARPRFGKRLEQIPVPQPDRFGPAEKWRRRGRRQKIAEQRFRRQSFIIAADNLQIGRIGEVFAVPFHCQIMSPRLDRRLVAARNHGQKMCHEPFLPPFHGVFSGTGSPIAW